jgi:FlaG/FlaF family flagellin (archaellin)
MKNRRKNKAVSAIVGTVLLLGITMVCFSVLNFVIFSFQSQSSIPYANLVGSFKGESIIIEHNGGEPLKSDTMLILYFPNNFTWINSTGKLLDDLNGDSYWNIGEQVQVNSSDYPEEVTDSTVTISIIDAESDYVIMTGVIQK